MSIRQTRWMLRLLIVLLWGGAAAAVGVAIVGLETEREELIVAKPRPVTQTDAIAETSRSFDQWWDVRLRRPLVDPPPPPPKPKPKPVAVKPPPKPKPKPKAKPKPPPPRPDVELVGTIVEPGRSLAIVVDGSGAIDMKGPGQTFDLDPEGLTLKSVGDGSAVVSFQDRDTTLELSDKPNKPVGGDRKGKKRTRVERKPTPTVSPADMMRMRRQMTKPPE